MFPPARKKSPVRLHLIKGESIQKFLAKLMKKEAARGFLCKLGKGDGEAPLQLIKGESIQKFLAKLMRKAVRPHFS